MLYAVIIVLWICILLPMWLRRHDEALESRSVDRFSSAMRTLSGRGHPDRREIVMPARETDPIHADGAARAVAAGRAVIAARRRRTLGQLLGAALVVSGLCLLGTLPGWLALGPALLLGGFLVHLRRQTRAQAAQDRRRLATRAAGQQRRQHAVVGGIVEVEQILPVARDRVDAEAYTVESYGAVTVALAADQPTDLPYDSEQDQEWEPVPVPLPTYVTAPKAPRSVRVIDLTKPGLWTSGHLGPDERPDATSATIDGSATEVRHEPAGTDGIVTGEVVIERRRAVND